MGCAFAICLEKKQQRDALNNVSMTFDKESAQFTRIGSFRQATITERLQDPQVRKDETNHVCNKDTIVLLFQSMKPVHEPPPVEKAENPFAVARPHVSNPESLMFQRHTSFRGFNQLQAEQGNSPFKRQLSLKLTELPSTLSRQKMDAASITPDEHQEQDLQQQQQQQHPAPVLDASSLISGISNPGNVEALKSNLGVLYQLSEAQRAAQGILYLVR